MKVGIYAGTFDPIHRGHINFAMTAIKEAELGRVVIVAEKEPYRKKPQASWDHRQAMIERATEQIESVDHDYAFAAQLSKQHTLFNMLRAAESHYGQANEYWLLVGSDILTHMHTWDGIKGDHGFAGVVVALRDDHTKQWVDQRIEEFAAHDIWLDVIVIEGRHPHVSSSIIRQEIAAGVVDTKNISAAVARYIFKHHLYK